MPRNSLTPKQQRFVEEYLVDLNATQAATRAGYSAKTANEQGARLLANVSVAAVITEKQKMREKRTEITQDRVITELARIAFLDPRKVMTWGPLGVVFSPSSELSEDEARAVAEASQTVTREGGTIRVKLADKMAALKLLGEHLGMFSAKPSGDADDIASGLLRAAIRESVERRARERRTLIESGEAGGSGLAAHVADAAPPRND